MARLNLAIIKEEVRAKLHNSSLSDTQLERWVDISQDRILRSVECDFLLDVKTITCVAAQREYFVESAFNRILHVLDNGTSDILSEISDRSIRNSDPDFSDTGDPTAYAITGYTEVMNQFTLASTIYAISSSAADASKTVRIRGLSAGVERTETLALSGSTSTLVYSPNQDLLARLSAVCVGNVTITEVTGGKVLNTIPPGMLRRTFMKIALYPIPTGTNTLKVLVYRNPYNLTDDEDIPDLPSGWENLVLTGVLIEAHRNAYEFDVADKMELLFARDIDQLKAQQGDTTNRTRRIRTEAKFGSATVFGRMPKIFGP